MIINAIDPIALKQEIDRQYISHTYFRVNRHGEQVPDDTQMRIKVYDAVKGKVARSRGEIAKNSLTNGELYALTFPNAPGTDAKSLQGLDDLNREVRKALMRKVWGLTQPRRIGFIQKRLGAEDTGLVLCRTMSTRGVDDAEVCFVTDNADLIMQESVMPQIESLVKKADDLRLHTEMVVERQPTLESRITKELGLGVRRIEAALPAPNGNGNQPAAAPTKELPA
jgi:hypothetical protein